MSNSERIVEQVTSWPGVEGREVAALAFKAGGARSAIFTVTTE